MQDLYEKIHDDAEFHQLEKKRGRFSWLLAAIMFITYFSFILIVAFAPHIFARPVFPGQVMTWGIPAGVAVIMLVFLLTGIYVYRANSEYDRLMQIIVKHTAEGNRVDE
ncbi:MAG: DUF485 domain-containing protein [Gammaproteobacteria bacterium]